MLIPLGQDGMTMNTARIEKAEGSTARDGFLSDAFGYPCHVLSLPCDMDALAVELADLPAPAFVWAKVTGRDDPAFAALGALGFRIAVEEITYERPGDAPAPAMSAPDDIALRHITQQDAADASPLAAGVGALAAANLTTSRFHQDPLISGDIAAEVKKRWAMNFFAGKRGQEMFVATSPDGRIAGFNQVLVEPGHKVIDLICTAGHMRRKGVARALVAAMFEPGLPTRVGSQANNKAADAFYKSLGFVPVGTSLCLHWHRGGTA